MEKEFKKIIDRKLMGDLKDRIYSIETLREIKEARKTLRHQELLILDGGGKDVL